MDGWISTSNFAIFSMYDNIRVSNKVVVSCILPAIRRLSADFLTARYKMKKKKKKKKKKTTTTS